MKRSRRYQTLADSYEKSQFLGLADAVVQVKKLANAKCDESIDAALRLGIDPRHADQMVRGTVVLPHGTGKSVRVAVFAKGDHAKEAQEAGADVVGKKDRIPRPFWADSTTMFRSVCGATTGRAGHPQAGRS